MSRCGYEWRHTQHTACTYILEKYNTAMRYGKFGQIYRPEMIAVEVQWM